MARPAEPLRVQVRRRMPAPRDVVYAAWTNPEGLSHWMCRVMLFPLKQLSTFASVARFALL